MTELRILIADDHVFYREGVKTMLHASGREMVVVGEAADGDEAVRQAAALRPDVVLMDLKMPGVNGIEATRRIVARHPGTAVLIVTMFDDDSVFAAVRAGARGYVLKDANLDDLTRAITAVFRGEAIFGAPVAARLARHLTAGSADLGAPHPFPDLTEREREVLDLMIRGRPNAEIALTLNLTVKTVRNYVSGVLAKLQVADRSQAIVKAREAGYPPTP